MEKLEKSSGERLRKIIVGSGNKETFERYTREYDLWLDDVEIYFVDEKWKNAKDKKLPM